MRKMISRGGIRPPRSAPLALPEPRLAPERPPPSFEVTTDPRVGRERDRLGVCLVCFVGSAGGREEVGACCPRWLESGGGFEVDGRKGA